MPSKNGSLFSFRHRHISNRGEGLVRYNVYFASDFRFLGMLEGKPGHWQDSDLLFKKETRLTAPVYKTLEAAAHTLVNKGNI